MGLRLASSPTGRARLRPLHDRVGRRFEPIIPRPNEKNEIITKCKNALSENISEHNKEKEKQKLEEIKQKALLRDVLTSGENISDFSKNVFSNIDYTVTEQDAVTTSQNFIETFQKVSYDNIQADIKEIYYENCDSSITLQTINITKGMVDQIAKLEGVSSEEILTNEKYADELREASYDLIKSYIEIYAVGVSDTDALKTLGENIKS